MIKLVSRAFDVAEYFDNFEELKDWCCNYFNCPIDLTEIEDEEVKECEEINNSILAETIKDMEDSETVADLQNGLDTLLNQGFEGYSYEIVEIAE